jgi:hypothetical protein
VGNYTQAFGNETALPFGWADQNCTASHIVICKVSEPGVSPWYPTNSTNITFYLNTSLVRACAACCGMCQDRPPDFECLLAADAS